MARTTKIPSLGLRKLAKKEAKAMRNAAVALGSQSGRMVATNEVDAAAGAPVGTTAERLDGSA